MSEISTSLKTKMIIEKYDFHFQKKYGQNFLIDENILNKIIDAGEITKDDFVLEIGPGIGTMTQLLCQKARKVCAVEIDTNLIPILEDTLSDYDNVTIINEDVLKLDIKKLTEEENDGKPIKVVANLPYYITTPIVMGLLENHVPLESITIMIQKEVAQRMQEGPGSKEYGALSLAVQYYTIPQVMLTVPPSSFIPQPKVESAVIRLKCINPPVLVDDERFMFDVIRASFNQRRKTLANGLKNADSIHASKEDIDRTIEEMGLNPSVRGETLTLEQFAMLANKLQKFQ